MCVCVFVCVTAKICESDNGDKVYAYILHGMENSQHEYVCM